MSKAEQKKRPQLPEGVTQQDVNNWKDKYDDVRLLRLPKDERIGSENSLTVVARNPDRDILSEYLKHSDKNPKLANEILVKNCLLSGMDEVLENDRLFLTAVTKLAELIPIGQAEMVKL